MTAKYTQAQIFKVATETAELLADIDGGEPNAGPNAQYLELLHSIISDWADTANMARLTEVLDTLGRRPPGRTG